LKQISADQVAADQVAANKVAAEKLVANKVAADKLAADKVDAHKVAADKVVVDKVAADKVVADKVAADKVATENAKQKTDIENYLENKFQSKLPKKGVMGYLRGTGDWENKLLEFTKSADSFDTVDKRTISGHIYDLIQPNSLLDQLVNHQLQTSLVSGQF